MDQIKTGKFIADERKKKGYTQRQLAEQLGVSDKTISKWENGTCMPDYSIIQKLCDALHVTLPELMDGEDAAENSVHVYDNEQILGIASGAMSKTTGGTDVQDFISGVLMGLSVAEILAGIWVAGKTFLRQ